ncbi:MAG: B12-binding domain-containing radical SAM protein [Desulfosudaceae bacterium]
MKVLLVSTNTETINMPVLPLGLFAIARATREAGHEIMVINTMDADQMQADVIQAIEDFQPELIGISVRNIDDQSMTATRFLLDPVRSLITVCRRQTTVPIVIGGAGYSIFPEASLAWLGADMGLRGPAEQSFLRLLACLQQGRDPAAIPGLYLPGGQAGGAGVTTDNIPDNINNAPLPRPEDLLVRPAPTEKDDLWIPFQTRRGCSMDCSYCSTPAIEGRITRQRQPAKVADMLAAYTRAGYSRFFFVDNTFNLPPAYARDLCDQIIAKKLNLSWRGIVYPWQLDDELAAKMAAAGCAEVSLGFESGSAGILQSLNKKFTPADVRQVSAALKRADIRQTGFLLLGAPGETPATVEESLAFAESLELDAMKITCGIRLYPETPLARQAAAEGLISAADDLLFPKFYVAEAVRDILPEQVEPWMTRHDNWF